MAVLFFIIFVLWLLGFVFLYRVPLCQASAAAEPCKVSVIVPARDEAHNLPTLLASLAEQQPAPFEIVVVDDGSADRTAEVARAHGATVVASKPLPDGWRGKTWACYQGAEAARGEVLMFVDADTFFEPGGFERILGAWENGDAVLSLGPWHAVQRPYEDLSAFFNLLMTAGTGAFTLFSAKHPPAGLFGQFLMLDRGTYFETGGHKLVKGRILENFYLAGELARRGVPMQCRGGKRAFSMRMYPGGLAELVNGWSKAFSSGAAQTPRWILLLTIVWITGGLLAPIYLATGLVAVSPLNIELAALLYVLYAAQVWTMLRRLGAFRWYTAAFYPVPLVFYLVVFTRSAILSALGKEVAWKGRRMNQPVSQDEPPC